MKKIIILIIFFMVLGTSYVFAHEEKMCAPSLTPQISPILDTPTPQISTNSGSVIPEFQNSGNNSTPSTGSTTNAPAAPTCNIPFVSPGMPVFHRISPTQIQLNWWPSTDTVDSQSVNYGYSADSLIYGAIVNSSQLTVNYLQPNVPIFVEICAYKNGCASCTPIIDP